MSGNGKNTKKDKKYSIAEETWFILFTLFVFYPVGVFCLWNEEKFTKNTRIFLSVFCGIIFIYALFIGYSQL